MAPSAYYSDFHSAGRLAQRAESDDCSGWDCLGDAAQFGIILVIVAVVLALVYLYWRLQIKPGLQSGRDDSQNPVTGYWELSRRDPSRVSITIYREPRQLSDPEPVETDGPISPPGKGQIGQTQQQENNILGQVPQQLGMAHTSDIHLVPPPPPPPPVVWSASPSSTVPQPPIVGPIAFVQSGHPPATFHSTPLTLGTATVPYPADVPPPYFGYANLQGQYPQAEVVPVPQPACAPPPVTPSTPTRNKKEKNVPTTPVAEPQSKWRRWFSRGKSPATGHARTLSDSSSPASQSRSPSPPPFPTPSPPRKRRRDHSTPSRRKPQSPKQNRRTRPNSQSPRRSTQTSARDRRHNTPPSESESSISSSYLNTSLEAVLNTNNPHPTRSTRTRPRPRPRAFSNPETTQPHHQHPNHAPQTRIRPSDTVPLAHDLHRRQLSDDSRQPGPSQRQRQRQRRHPTPSPDLQFPSPERRRPRVSFTLPEGEEQEGRGGVLGASSSAGSSSVSLGSLESGRSVELRGEGRSRERETRGGGGGGRRREEEEEEEEEGRRPGVADRVTERFYLMRRALRGGE